MFPKGTKKFQNKRLKKVYFILKQKKNCKTKSFVFDAILHQSRNLSTQKDLSSEECFLSEVGIYRKTLQKI